MFYPTNVSPEEVEEIAQLFVDDGGMGSETLAEAIDDVHSYPLAKFSKYTTDGPGYSGDIFVFVGGILTATVIFRNREGKLEFSND